MEVQSKPFGINFKSFLNLKKDAKIYIYPNLNGLGLGLFIFFCFLISVFYENNSGLLISIVIFASFLKLRKLLKLKPKGLDWISIIQY